MLNKLAMVMVVCAVPMTAHAQFINPFAPCNTCGPPAPPPCMVPVMPMVQQPIVQTRLRPVVEMRMRQQQVTTYRPVTTTQIRKEAVTVDVPVTTTKQVTVDEGGYKMVWVPNVVTKNVAETTIQKQVQYRDVPYQVVQNVPQVQTQLIPERTVRYVPETRTVGIASGCCGQTAPMQALIPHALPTAVIPTPTTAVAPIPQHTTVEQNTAQPDTAHVPQSQPVPQTSQVAPEVQGDWVKVPQRAAGESEVELQSYEQASEQVHVVAEPQVAPRRLFTPVPSAATAWRAASALR